MMSNPIYKYRFLIGRRVTQIAVMLLFIGANYWGWTILTGNLTAANAFGTVPFSDPYAVLQMMAAGFIGSSTLLLGGLIVWAFYVVIAGRAFCSWICPMNIISNLVRWLRKVFAWQKNAIELPRHLRYWLLALSFIVSAIVGIAAFEMISPVAMLHRGLIFGMGAEGAIIAAVFFFDLGIHKDAWCGHICPLGGFYALTGRFALLKVKHIEPNCTKCNNCFEVCPEEQVLAIVGQASGIIRSGACVNCGRCIEVCDDKALHFSINDFKPIKP